MPYEVTSRCEVCREGDPFVIGLWPRHAGVFACGACRRPVNVPLEEEACPGCGDPPAIAEFYDHAASIPYLGGASIGPLEPVPVCPKCGGGRLSFETTGHFNVGTLGSSPDGRRPWIGRDTLEKAIFAYAMMPVCMEFDLRPDEILRRYHLDVPAALMAGRRVSLPILLDIRTHLLATAACGEADFTVTPKFRSAIHQGFGGPVGAARPRRRWWPFRGVWSG